MVIQIRRLTRRLGFLTAALALSACSSHGATPMMPQALPPLGAGPAQVNPGPDAFGSWAYTCSINASVCPLYTVSGSAASYSSTLSVAGNPSGAFATTAGKWYVALRSTQDVAVYKSTSSGPANTGITLSDAGQQPADVAVNTAHGLVVVSNLTADSHNVNSLSVYAHNATTPTRALHFTAPGGGGGYGVGVATDSAGNCYWAVDDANAFVFYIVDFAACKGKGTIVFTSGKFDSAGGVALDGSNDLYFVDNTNQKIYRCTGTGNCKIIAGGFQNITFVRFDDGWHHLWTTDSSAAKLYALDPATGHKLSTTSEPTAANSLAIAPGPAY